MKSLWIRDTNTEEIALCKDCIWRGSIHGMDKDRCDMFPLGKPERLSGANAGPCIVKETKTVHFEL